jgi:hypothetical protein
MIPVVLFGCGIPEIQHIEIGIEAEDEPLVQRGVLEHRSVGNRGPDTYWLRQGWRPVSRAMR